MTNSDVQQIRQKYGPTDEKGGRRRGHLIWPRISSSWKHEFGGDKDRFFGFFVVGAEAGLSSSRRRKATDNGMVLFQLMSEAIPHCKDVKEEAKGIYQGEDGKFSEELWSARWGSHNMREVCRELGKEKY